MIALLSYFNSNFLIILPSPSPYFGAELQILLCPPIRNLCLSEVMEDNLRGVYLRGLLFAVQSPPNLALRYSGKKSLKSINNFNEVISISCIWCHQAVFVIIRGPNSRFFIFCPIWLKFWIWVNFRALILNFNEKIWYKHDLNEKRAISFKNLKILSKHSLTKTLP